MGDMAIAQYAFYEQPGRGIPRSRRHSRGGLRPLRRLKQRRWPERDEYEEAMRLREAEDRGEVAIVEYQSEGGSIWRPHSITTRRRIKTGRHAGEWTYDEYDADYSRTHGSVYVHLSGSGGETLGPYCRAEELPGRVWAADGVALRDSDGNLLDAAGLRKLGYLRVRGPTPSPFADTMDGDTFWCDECQDRLPDDADGASRCCRCDEEMHVHVGTIVVAFGEVELDDDGEPETNSATGLVPGLYRIKRFPYYADGMIEGYVIDSALERVGDVPSDLEEDGYPCGHLCSSCGEVLSQNRGAA